MDMTNEANVNLQNKSLEVWDKFYTEKLEKTLKICYCKFRRQREILYKK